MVAMMQKMKSILTQIHLECALNGKLSESSGYAGSDLYDYEAFCSDDSDVGLPKDNHASQANTNLLFNSQ